LQGRFGEFVVCAVAIVVSKRSLLGVLKEKKGKKTCW
jgi:hypothetical protein